MIVTFLVCSALVSPHSFMPRLWGSLSNEATLGGQLENTETRERKRERKRKRERERKLENLETRWAIEPDAASESELLL